MDNQPSKIDKIISFIKQNKWVILAGALVLFFLYILILSITSSPIKAPPSEQPGTKSTPVPTRITPQPVKITEPDITYAPSTFKETALQGKIITRTPIGSDSLKYTYQSSNPNRPNELIVKDGIVIYQRTVLENKYIYHYTNTMGAPDYVFQSSKFYGSNTMTYVYLKEGTAFVADAKTTMVKEQLSFPPSTIEEFKQRYAEDVSDFTVIPTVPDE